MGSLEAEEALLKKKLEATDNLEDRREIRKQLRELRNRKFEEEVKKIQAGDYRPGKDRSAITNGGESSLGSIGRSRSVKDDDGEDTYGLSNVDNEDDLQAMLNDTPFTETEKRKKIRARIREIRNQKLGIGEPVVVKRHNRDIAASVKTETQKETVEKQNSVDLNVEKEVEEPRNSYRSSYRSKYRLEDDAKIDNKEPEVSSRNVALSRTTKEEESNTVKDERVNGYADTDESDKRVDEDENEEEKNDEDGIVEEDAVVEEDVVLEEAGKEVDLIESENVENDEVDEEDEPVDDVDVEEEGNVDEEEYEKEEGLGEEEFSQREEVNDADFNEVTAEKQNDDEADYREECEDEEVEVEGGYKEDQDGDQRSIEDDQLYSDEDDDVQKVEDNVNDDAEDKGRMDDEEYFGESNDEQDDKKGSSGYEENVREESISGESGKQRASSYNPSQDDEEEEEARDDYEERGESEEEYSRSEAEDEDEAIGSSSKKAQLKYSDDSYSDYTATDDGSSISGKRFEEDQNLDDYSPKSPSSSLRRQQGPSIAAKIDKVFQEKEPGIQEGKDFKEKLKKTDKSFQTGGKKVVEQVDFRTVLRQTDKPKRFGEKPSHGPEQVDFRNLLQSKVKTKTLADKGLTAEQVDFRTVLKAGAVEKSKPVQRKTSAAEQVDFRTVLKKEPSVKSRKVSTDDKEIFRKIRAGSDLVANAEAKSIERKTSESRSGRPSIEALKRSGSMDKAKGEFERQRKESAGSENDPVSRKAGRPSLDALKESGELGKTRDKSAKFQKSEDKVFKKPVAPPPKPKKIKEEDVEELIVEKEESQQAEIERPTESKQVEDTAAKAKDTVDKEARSGRRQRRTVKEDDENKHEQQNEKQQEEEAENKTRTRRSRDRDDKTRSRRNVPNDENADKPRSRRSVRGEESVEAVSDSSRVAKEKEISKEAGLAKRSEETEDKERRVSLKSEDKRARNRRLRRDQNEVVRGVEAKKAASPEPVDDHDGKAEENVISVKSSSLERVSVRVQLSGSKQPEIDKKLKDEEDSDEEEEIGTRRNRRRLLRKGSIEDQKITRVSVKTEKIKEPIDESDAVKTSSTKENHTDDVDGKPTRATTKRHVETASKSSATKAEDKSTEKKSPSDAAKSRQAKMADLDAKLAERRRQRAIDNRKKQQQTKNNRMAFKEKLESGAPTTERSQSPALQRANSNMTKLLHWCQKMTDGYPNVEVTNFNKSWSDGLAFCALLHNFVPEKILFHKLSPKNPRENFEIAFSVASEQGVAELLEVDDMVNMEIPDTKSVITYLHAIYQTLVADRR